MSLEISFSCVSLRLGVSNLGREVGVSESQILFFGRRYRSNP